MIAATAGWLKPFTEAVEVNTGLPAVPSVLLILGGLGYAASGR